ncbi:MAG TPA: HipA domain-containing protein [Gammaproteobacteria bacterium]|nr:HipA domain-containing protein [Gammaproteobacteria bacterium]
MSSTNNHLDIFLKHEKIAELHISNDQLSWSYTTAWQQIGFAVSPHLPLKNNIPAGNTQIFLRNMLPEGHPFETLITYFNISRNNTFALMRILGPDTAGGLIMLPANTSLPKESIFRVINPLELQQRLDDREHFNLLIWDEKPRLSVAGVQDKLNVVVYPHGELGFGDGKLCSTHILKFERHKLAHLVLNEYITMKLAKKCGLEVAEVEVVHFGSNPALLVKRFDRILQADLTVQRRHMIDGCQALNLPPEYKYERNLGSGRDVAHIRDGASFEKLFRCADLCINPAVTKQKMLSWALFNLLICNFDAHGKNVSFFVDEYGIALTPFYDLVNIKMYANFNSEMAMGFGDTFDSDSINAYQIIEFADACRLSKSFVASRLQMLANDILSNLNSVINAINATPEENAYLSKYTELVTDRCKYFLNKIEEIKTLKI